MTKEKKKKPKRPIPKTPRGFRDYMSYEGHFRTEIIKKISAIYEIYGFEFLETSAVETVDSLGKFLPDVDRPNDGIFAWLDDDDTWLALRYDHTAPLARFYSQYRNDLPNPYRRYSYGPVWRNEKPGPDRFRQFYQIDADTVGTPQIGADAEMCMMVCDALELIGMDAEDYKFKLNNRKILSGIIQIAGIKENQMHPVDDTFFQNICRAIDKFDRLGLEGVRKLLGSGRRDESGDFTDGLNLSTGQIDFFTELLSSKGSRKEFLTNLRNILKKSEIGTQGLNELEEMVDIFLASGYSEDKFSFDPSVVRGLGYYTGPVFEVELNKKIIDKKGNEHSFGSISGGGRYDDLVKRFTGQNVPATGVSIGVDRLIAALKIEEKIKQNTLGPILVTVMDKERYKDYQKIVNMLRQGGLRAEIFLGNPKDLGRQLKYADQRKSPFAIIQGSEEAEKEIVQLKDLNLGSKLSETISSNEEWKAHPSQFEVPLANLVSEIKTLLEPKI